MIPLIALIIGGAVGWTRAAKRGGRTSDRLHYAVVHGLGFLLVGMGIDVILGYTGLFTPGAGG